VPVLIAPRCLWVACRWCARPRHKQLPQSQQVLGASFAGLLSGVCVRPCQHARLLFFRPCVCSRCCLRCCPAHLQPGPMLLHSVAANGSRRTCCCAASSSLTPYCSATQDKRSVTLATAAALVMTFLYATHSLLTLASHPPVSFAMIEERLFS
jgi:hypothetical protein